MDTMQIAKKIVGEMNSDDREQYTRAGWREGVATMLRDDWEGADLDSVLDNIEWLISDAGGGYLVTDE